MPAVTEATVAASLSVASGRPQISPRNLFLEGPTSTRTVESNFGTIRDTISDRWYGSGIKIAGQIREITGAAS